MKTVLVFSLRVAEQSKVFQTLLSGTELAPPARKYKHYKGLDFQGLTFNRGERL